MIHISHKSIRSEELLNNDTILIASEIIDYSNPNINLSVTASWKYSAEDGPFIEIPLSLESGMYIGGFPELNSNSEIDYFITATNILGNTVSHPHAGWHVFNTLEITLGDINGDSSINVQDIILTVNLVLNNEYNNLADLNSDGTIDVLDVVQLVNIILN